MTVTVVIPTIEGREESYERCVKSFEGYDIVTINDAPTCGDAWVRGAAEATGDYLCLAADDWEAHPGFCGAMIEAVDAGKHPAALVLNPDGGIQSCGGAGTTSLCSLGCADWNPVEWSPTPFLTRKQWTSLVLPHAETLADLHYSSDVMISYVLGRADIPCVVRTEAIVSHFNHPVGRGAGQDQSGRSSRDAARFDSFKASL